MLVGGGAIVGAKVVYQGNCDSDSCISGNVLALLLGALGLGLVAGGSIGLAVEHNSKSTP